MRVAVVGCGHIAEQHLAQLGRLRGAEVVALCDLDPERAARLAARYRVPQALADLGELLRSARPDVVHVLTPPASHPALTLQALAAGAHVLVEKPMATHTAVAREMASAARDAGRTLSVCHNFLYVPAYRRARREIDRGSLGRIVSAEVHWRVSSLDSGQRYETARWIQELPGGVFHEVGPHLAYLLVDLLGPLDVVQARCAASPTGEPEELRVLLGAQAGSAAMTIALRSLPLRKLVRVHGTRRSLVVDLGTSTLLRLRGSGVGLPSRAMRNLDLAAQLALGTCANGVRAALSILPRSHETFLRCYYAALAAGTPPPVTAEHGIATVEVLDEIWRRLGSR